MLPRCSLRIGAVLLLWVLAGTVVVLQGAMQYMLASGRGSHHLGRPSHPRLSNIPLSATGGSATKPLTSAMADGAIPGPAAFPSVKPAARPGAAKPQQTEGAYSIESKLKLSWVFGLSAVVAAVSFVGTTMSTNIDMSGFPLQAGVERVANLNNDISTIEAAPETMQSAPSVSTPPMQWFGGVGDQDAKVASDSTSGDVKSWFTQSSQGIQSSRGMQPPALAPQVAPKGMAAVDGGPSLDSQVTGWLRSQVGMDDAQVDAKAELPAAPRARFAPKATYHSIRSQAFKTDHFTFKSVTEPTPPSPLESVGNMMSQLPQVANPFQQLEMSQQNAQPWFSFGQPVPPPKAPNPMAMAMRPFKNAANYFQNNPLKAVIPIATAAACAVYSMMPRDAALDRKEQELAQQTTVFAGARTDRFYELVLGSLYEAEDMNNNWWRIRIDGWNSNGSYKATVLGLDGGDLSVWSEVWPENCRLQEEDQQHVKNLAEACRQTKYSETQWYVA